MLSVLQSKIQSGTSVNPSLAYTSPLTAGSALAVIVWANGATASISDTNTNTWAQFGATVPTNGGAGNIWCFVCDSAKAGATTVHVNTGGAAGAISLLIEVGGFTAGPIFEQFVGFMTAGPTEILGPVMPSAECVIVTACQPDGNAGTAAVGAPFTNLVGSFSTSGYLHLTTPASTTADWSGLTGSNQNGLVMFDIADNIPATAEGTGPLPAFPQMVDWSRLWEQIIG